ncbi:TetR family transcriptional regulator [Pseudodesulfovibrio sp. JC047]|uniref:TetR/AcrR family transcriptional regulator n=1 Tax=Pseudodesulfovibrio sp. JC047 TaxID=2683199 RepID=UPI0013D71471|nr:TetR/AcrR family transcriptional regulator [Pseudodesulfovibrio sp. JC047]NDV18410.1 TetR family transcriptional regulator [Pseudodesulfovibrio sp. JC047]
MPKIIDHERYRKELAAQATKIFQQHGYAGMGMRQIAKELGISKSALYHYFPSKEALFTACSKAVTSFEADEFDAASIAAMNRPERARALIDFFMRLEKDFKGELTVLLDYLRPLSPSLIAKDENMRHSNQQYTTMITAFVGPDKAQFVLCLMYGLLLQRLFDGGTSDLQDFEEKLIAIMDH